ncbi:MAG: phosphatidate cytidylyltransferase [Euryarchaeota archaeon]|nr:phosphatidate cytidylyltransferase [Euryarchaeota archaeon]
MRECRTYISRVTIKSEITRKTLHLTGLLIPVSYIYMGKELTLLFIAISIVVFFMIEPYRISKNTTTMIIEGIRPLFNEETFKVISRGFEMVDKKIREITRREEETCIGAHLYFAIAAMINVLFFPAELAMATITVATISDALAAIIGKALGKHRFKNSKSLEGSTAFFVSALIIFYFFIPFNYAILGALVGTAVEFFNVPPNDNFSNQLAMSFFIYMAMLL